VPLPLVEALILVDEVLEALARVGDGLDFVVLVDEVTISDKNEQYAASETNEIYPHE
jgi:hypothetical protein